MLKRTSSLAAALFIVFFAGPISWAQTTGADTYKVKCQMCHGADGLGATPVGKSMKVGSFTSPEVSKESDAELIAIVKKGKGKMPSFAGKLTDVQITDLLAHIHTLQK